MNRPPFLPALALILTVIAAAPPSSAGTAGAEEVVARIGDDTITQAALEEAAAADLQRLVQERHQILEATLTRMVDEELLAREARRQGVSEEELLASAAEKGAKVPDAAVEAFFESNQARIRQPKETVLPQIRAYLEEQQRNDARSALIERLRSAAGVEILLEPLRVDVSTADAPAKGPEDAPVTIVEFADFQCPPCGRIRPVLAGLEERYGDRLRLEFRHNPLHSIHPQAQKAAEAALCARDQGRFWEMHDALFEGQRNLSPDSMKAHADALGLDVGAFTKCLDSDKHREAVLADQKSGNQAGVSVTPTLYVNGRLVPLGNGEDPEELISRMIDEELARKSG